MGVRFPGESPEYRVARDRLLEEEVELRRAMEAVAVARRGLPPGGPIPEDYVFQGAGDDGAPTDVRLSELFAPGKDSLVIYSFMFPRDPGDDRKGPTEGETPERILMRSTLDADLQAALDALPEAFRQAVWLRDVEEFSYAEIAAMLEVPIGTVMSRIYRGRKLLAALIVMNEGFSELVPPRPGSDHRVQKRRA